MSAALCSGPNLVGASPTHCVGILLLRRVQSSRVWSGREARSDVQVEYENAIIAL